MKRLVILVILAGAASTPFAGARSTAYVTVNLTGMYASGNLGDARSSTECSTSAAP